MNNPNCGDVADTLVEFSDGELSDEHRSRVERHLQDCAACRREVELLRRSLASAQAIWQETGTQRATSSLPPRRIRIRRALAAASAAAVLIAGGFALWRSQMVQPDEIAEGSDAARQARSPQQPGADPQGSPVAGAMNTGRLDSLEESSPGEIDSMIAFESQAARLAAAAEMLSAEPDLQAYCKQAEEYLVANYQQAQASRLVRAESPSPDSPSRATQAEK